MTTNDENRLTEGPHDLPIELSYATVEPTPWMGRKYLVGYQILLTILAIYWVGLADMPGQVRPPILPKYSLPLRLADYWNSHSITTPIAWFANALALIAIREMNRGAARGRALAICTVIAGLSACCLGVASQIVLTQAGFLQYATHNGMMSATRGAYRFDAFDYVGECLPAITSLILAKALFDRRSSARIGGPEKLHA
jgi:hypothetical protein